MPGNDVRRQERHLLRFREEVVRPAIEHEAADDRQRDVLLRDELGRIEDIVGLRVGERLVEHLHAEIPFRRIARRDRLPQIAPVIVGIGARDLDRLVPQRRLHAEPRPPVELHEARLACRVDEAERVHAEAFHHAKRPRDRAVRHRPHDHVHALGHQRHEIPERVVRRGRLRKAAVRLRLHRMDEVRKLDRVLDEEHRNVVADQVPVALVRVELDREAADIARRVLRSLRARDRREAAEHRRALALLRENRGARQLGNGARALEVAVRARAAGMHDALRNPLVVEVEDLLAKDEVFEQRRPAGAETKAVLVVGDPRAVVRRQVGGARLALTDLLVGFAAIGTRELRARRLRRRLLGCHAGHDRPPDRRMPAHRAPRVRVRLTRPAIGARGDVANALARGRVGRSAV